MHYGGSNCFAKNECYKFWSGINPNSSDLCRQQFVVSIYLRLVHRSPLIVGNFDVFLYWILMSISIKISLIKPFFFSQSRIHIEDLVLSIYGNSQHVGRHILQSCTEPWNQDLCKKNAVGLFQYIRISIIIIRLSWNFYFHNRKMISSPPPPQKKNKQKKQTLMSGAGISNYSPQYSVGSDK